MTRFHYPKLSALDLGIIRSPGAGLGNLLFPIFRAMLGSLSDVNSVFVYPTLPQVKFGPFLRRESDKRTYFSVIRSRDYQDWVVFAQSRMARLKIPETSDGSHLRAFQYAHECSTIVYEGLKNYFYDLEGFEYEINEWLSDNVVSFGEKMPRPEIVVHVRQGDFSEYTPSRIDTCYRTPSSWYERALVRAKQELGSNAQVMLLTDGIHSDIARDLGLKTYDVPPKGLNALQTVLLGSQSKILIASKSTFSMWMRFLGSAEVYWEPGFDTARYFKVDDRDKIIW